MLDQRCIADPLCCAQEWVETRGVGRNQGCNQGAPVTLPRAGGLLPMKLLLIAPAGLAVQVVKGKHAHHLNLAVIAALADKHFDEIKIIEEEFERLDLNERA